MDDHRAGLPPLPGRGTRLNPANRFECLDIQPDPDWPGETPDEAGLG